MAQAGTEPAAAVEAPSWSSQQEGPWGAGAAPTWGGHWPGTAALSEQCYYDPMALSQILAQTGRFLSAWLAWV